MRERFTANMAMETIRFVVLTRTATALGPKKAFPVAGICGTMKSECMVLTFLKLNQMVKYLEPKRLRIEKTSVNASKHIMPEFPHRHANRPMKSSISKTFLLEACRWPQDPATLQTWRTLSKWQLPVFIISSSMAEIWTIDDLVKFAIKAVRLLKT